MNLVRIHLIERLDDTDTYEEWTWQLEENYQLSDKDSELIKKRIERYGYFDGDRGFIDDFKCIFDLDSDMVKNDLQNSLYLRIYRFLLSKKKRIEAIDNILKNN